MGKRENTGFICAYCSRTVVPVTNGSYRNHCPFCLYSKHLDIKPGDRRCTCHGLMKPVGLQYSTKKGFQIIHECLECGSRTVNKVAEFTAQPDDTDELIKLLQ
ncbi:hypothetical protein AMJ87_07875 [candidate division WOR_3 bacterium SM23_60]|uniref:RNHCP domain-containing protein n=1 Tax=candidate division WOR_3 bacterium SM23_60 TaxID=1703780 RepID=A0A0S8GGQ2_UNCW3|nr:MAG: hypothetical protein AMJ87_07875 [candidate division WOR_3 bacterium SM23_60]